MMSGPSHDVLQIEASAIFPIFMSYVTSHFVSVIPFCHEGGTISKCIGLFVVHTSVVYFDQHLGAMHFTRWSK